MPLGFNALGLTALGMSGIIAASSGSTAGASMSGAGSMSGGAATGSASASGATMSGAGSLAAGAASGTSNGDASAPGATMSGAGSVNAGTAAGSASVLGTSMTGTATISGGSASTDAPTPPPLPVNPRMLYVAGQRTNFAPMRVGEVEAITIDFGPALAPGETITSVSWSVVPVDNSDPAASSMIVGDPTKNGAIVSQMIRAGVPGIRYAPICTAQTSDGQILVLPEYGDGYLDITL